MLKEKMFRATSLICENVCVGGKTIFIDMNIAFGIFENKDSALQVANSMKFVFRRDLAPTIVGECSLNGEEYCIREEDISIREIIEEKVAILGEPIDCSTLEGKEKAIQALECLDPQYMISEDDMKRSDLTFMDIQSNWKNGYVLQNVAYGAELLNAGALSTATPAG